MKAYRVWSSEKQKVLICQDMRFLGETKPQLRVDDVLQVRRRDETSPRARRFVDIEPPRARDEERRPSVDDVVYVFYLTVPAQETAGVEFLDDVGQTFLCEIPVKTVKTIG